MASQDSTTEASKSSSSTESHTTLHSRSPAPGRTTPSHSSSSESKSDDESDTSTPPPKTGHQQKKDKKNKKQPLQQASVSSETAATKMAKRRRDEHQEEEEEGNDGICESSTKKKRLRAVQQASPVKENTKRKTLKQDVAETVSTPLSPQKSSKKVARRWDPKDELNFFNGLLAFSKKGRGLPKNIAPVYDHIRNTLDNQYSNRQFSEKSSRWKAKLRATKDKMKGNTFSFRNPHDAAVYNVCKQLWGGQDEAGDGDAENEEIDEDRSSGRGGGGDADNVGKASRNGKENGKEKKKKKPVVPKEEDGEEHLQKAEDQEDQGGKREEEEEENGPKSKEAAAMRMTSNVANDSGKPDPRKFVVMSPELYSQFHKEMDNMVTGMQSATAIMIKESELRTRGMIEDYFNTRTDQIQLPNNDMINGFHSAREAPVSSRVKDEGLEQKWHEQRILELETYSRRLLLLQEECKISMKELQAPARM